jgi:hypothetical protein
MPVHPTHTAIDPNTPSITFTGPNGWKYTSKVQDTQALAKAKVGREGRHHLDRSGAGVGGFTASQSA